MLRVLGTVQRQRNEHRKMQRLILDTSGRGQQDFLRHLMQDEGLPTLKVSQRSEPDNTFQLSMVRVSCNS